MTKKLLKHIRRASRLVILAAVSAVGSANAMLEHSPIEPFEQTFNVAGQETTITVDPGIAITGEDGTLNVDILANIDASQIQSQLIAELNKRHHYDECGTRLTTSGASATPTADGQLNFGLTARYEIWECITIKIPEIRWDTTRVMGIKTKVPKWYTRTERMKTKILSQSVRVNATGRIVTTDTGVTARFDVNEVKIGGLLKHLLAAFNGTIKNIVERELNKAVSKEKLNMPAELAAHDVKIKKAAFTDLGAGALGLVVQASGKLTQDQLATLISQQLAKR